jgi:hypothetical protein
VKQEEELREQLTRLDGRREEQERCLETALGQVEALRSELRMMTQRNAVRDEQLLKHVEVSAGC